MTAPSPRAVEEALGRLLIVIPSIEGGSLLARMFASMRDLAPRCVVLDQGSGDDTAAVCARFGVELVQLGDPRTYTQACNAGMDIARARGCDYLLVANNDVRLVTDVVRQLLQAMLEDANLAVVAPAQLVIDEVRGERTMTYRVAWDLTEVSFVHDLAAPDRRTERLEADFCELTFAMVRISAASEVGFLDDDFGFFHEGADFGFRLREAGYASAYLPQAQIEHFTNSTFSGRLAPRRLEYLRKNRILFARKHLGYGVTYADHGTSGATSREIVNRRFRRTLVQNGLVDPTKAELVFAHPGTEPFDYLYTTWETSRLPAGWAADARRYRRVMTTSVWVKDVFEAEGVKDVSVVPRGVDVDLFTPAGPIDRVFEETTFLWFARNQYRKGLDVLRSAWGRLRPMHPRARLIVLGHGVIDAFGLRAGAIRVGGLLMAEVPDARISVWETVASLSDSELAALYRGVDFTVSTARAEGFGFATAEAMACGRVPIFGDFAGSADLACEGALLYSGTPVPADYSDKGFAAAGSWWEPDPDALLTRLDEACTMGAADYAARAQAGRRHITAGFTGRHAAFALRRAIKPLQHQREVAPSGYDAAEPPRRATVIGDIAGNLKQPMGREAVRLRVRRLAPGPVGKRLRLEAVFSAFDAEYYLRHNPDVASDGQDPLEHYIRYGWKEPHRRPSQHFDTPQYLAANPHVRGALLRGSEILRGTRPLARPSRNAVKEGALFIGYVEAGLGLGESLRGLVSAVSRESVPFAIHPYNVHVEDRFVGPFMPDRYDRHGRYRVNVFEAAADQLLPFYRHFGARLEGGYTIFRTYWELSGTPQEWATVLKDVHEIWAPTTFVADTFRTIYDGPITIVPTCVDVKIGKRYDRAYFGLDPARFTFLFSFDYFSWPARKNPLGVLRAFAEAFPGDENVALVIKTTGVPGQNPQTRALVAEAAARDPRIRVIDGTLTRDEVLSLIQQADCYVSLHRSEGFGLGMAEAMAMGKAVVGTDYSGSRDFLSEATGFPVPYTLRPLLDGEYAFTRDQVWAEPDESAAAAILRRVYEDPETRRSRAEAGRAAIATRFAPGPVGRLAAARLRQVLGSRPRGAAAASTVLRAQDPHDAGDRKDQAEEGKE